MQVYYTHIDSPVGAFLIAGTDGALCNTSFSSGRGQRTPDSDWREDAASLAYAIPQFEAYFAGENVDFDIPLAPAGTDFQKEVWGALRCIAYEEPVSPPASLS